MCDPVSLGIATLATAVIGTGASIIQGQNAAHQQGVAQQQALKQAADTKAANERALNEANQKSPDLSAIMATNQGLMQGGIGSTTLTGPNTPNNSSSSLSLGGNKLLGS